MGMIKGFKFNGEDEITLSAENAAKDGFSATIDTTYAKISAVEEVSAELEEEIFAKLDTETFEEVSGDFMLASKLGYTEECEAISSYSGIPFVGANSDISAVLPISIDENGAITNNGSDCIVSGKNAWAEGSNTIAACNHSHAEGMLTSACGGESHAEGCGTIANGDKAHAEGFNTLVSGEASHAEGLETSAIGKCVHTEGNETKTKFSLRNTFIDLPGKFWPDVSASLVSGWDEYNTDEMNFNPETSRWEGWYAVHNIGDYAHAEGSKTVAAGDYSHSEGSGTNALGFYSHAEGYGSIANGYASHAEGHTTKATSAMAHAEGSLTNAKAYASHAEGELAEVNSAADYSHAEGKTTYCIGRAAHAEGGYTIVNNDYEHAEGRFNYSHLATSGFGSSGNTIHSIGIGSGIFADGTSYDLLAHGAIPAGDVTAHSKNAVEVMQNGDMYVLGVGGYDGYNLSGQTIQYMLENPTSKYIIIDSSDYTDNVDVELRSHGFSDFGTLPTTCTGLTVKYIATIGNTLCDGSFQFTLPEGTTFGSLSVMFPTAVTECKYANMPETFEAGKTYQVTMVNGCCAIGVFE